MEFTTTSTVRSLVFTTLICLGWGTVHAQVISGPGGAAGAQPVPGQDRPVIGQPQPGQGPVIGQPMPGGQTGANVPQSDFSGSRVGRPQPGQSGYNPGLGSDPARNSLDRAKREAADIDRDGRLSPEEASRMPPGIPQ